MTDINTMNDFVSAIRETKAGPKPYDTTAEVVKIEGSTAWVHIPGGVDETPVQMSIDAKAGDSVNVRVSGGRAWITGNSSRPPTDDAVAHKADTRATEAQAVAEEAQETAEAASQLAQATKNYFWHDADGAHVSTVEGDASTGNNVLIDSDGMDIRDGTDVLASFEANKISLGNNSTESEISFCKDVVNLSVETYIDPLTVDKSARFIALDEHEDDEVSHYTYMSIGARNGNSHSSIPSAIILEASVEDNVSRATISADSVYINNNPIEKVLVPIVSTSVTTDLNDADEPGFYVYSSAASNKPSTAGGSLITMVAASPYVHQIAFPNNNQGTATAYTRLKYSGGWGAWAKL